MKKWKLILAALIFMLVCILVFYFSHHRSKPEIVEVVDRPGRPEVKRPVRKKAARPHPATKIDPSDKMIQKPYGCILKSAFDERTGILRQEIDTDCDGAADICRVEELNDYGEPVRIQSDQDCDGEELHCTEIEYNEYGEEIAYDFDTDCDGHIDKCLTFKRNNHGDIIESFLDKECDGEVGEKDWHDCTSYVYNEDSLAISAKSGKCGEKPEGCTNYEYDFPAGIRREKGDMNCDGTVDFCQVVFYQDSDKYPSNSFKEKECGSGTWESCYIQGEVGWVGNTFKGHTVCAKKYEELLKKVKKEN